MRRFLGTAAFVAAMAALPMLSLAQNAKTGGNATSEQTTQTVPKLQQQDLLFAGEAAEGGLAEVKLGQLATRKAASAAVKQFGQRMVEDHGAANKKLAAIAEQKKTRVPRLLNNENQRRYDHLASLSGQAFDREYMQTMVDDHQKDIKTFEDEAQNGTDADLKTFAQQTLPTLRDHLAQAQRIDKQLQGVASGSSGEQMQPAAGTTGSGQ